MKKVVFLFVFVFAVHSQYKPLSTEVKNDSKEYVSSIIQSFEMYNSYDVQVKDNEIILKSNELQKNRYKQKNILARNGEKHLCRVHNCEMKKEKVKVNYGLYKYLDLSYIEIRQAEFPNCGDIILGGCIMQEEKYKEEYVCEECIKKRNEWILKNRTSDYKFYNYKNKS